MNRSLVSTLPHPIASALLEFLDEDLARSADELSELFVAVIEYIGSVALADYLDGHSDPERCANNASLNGWLVSQLATGKAEAGHWARWTQIAVRATTAPAIPCLHTHVNAADLDDPSADLAWMLRFRNDVMHGGFVAPLSKIRQAIIRMEHIFTRLSPLWALRPLGCTSSEPDSVWYELSGLNNNITQAPNIDRQAWTGAGSVVLVDENNSAVLAIHPGCEVDPEGWMHLQHEWKKHHHGLFNRPAIHAFFERYNNERMGMISDSKWKQQTSNALPNRGYVARPNIEQALCDALSVAGQVVRLVGPEGSGRSTLAYKLSFLLKRSVFILPVEPSSVRMDPSVLRRWILQTLSQYFLAVPAPPATTKSRLNSKDKKMLAVWTEQMNTAASSKISPILVVDDSDLVGTGLYSGSNTKKCVADACTFGASMLLIHRPSGAPPTNGDIALSLQPWNNEEISAWGNAEELLKQTGGHTELLAHPQKGMKALQQRLAATFEQNRLGAKGLRILLNGPASIIEVADAIDAFTPELELSFRSLFDHLIESERPPDPPNGSPTRTYQLHPGITLALRTQEGL